MMYLHNQEHWWEFRYDTAALVSPLANVRSKQGYLLGQMANVGFSQKEETSLHFMSSELVHSSLIEGETLKMEEVRSSIARHLGLNQAGLTPASRYVDGVVEMMIDATQRYAEPLADERLFGWHNVLFPTGMSGHYRIQVGMYRTGEMQVVSGALGHELIYYQAPSAERVPQEMARFLSWVNGTQDIAPVLKAAIAHLWFVSIHPFDDGNGRITRAITDMLLARADASPLRFYSMSSVIKQHQKGYYEVLERTQRGDGDITDWLLWFLDCLDKALDGTLHTFDQVARKSLFWERYHDTDFNERQRKMLNLLFDGFYGKLTSGKWAKMAKCSSDTALNDIRDLVGKGILIKGSEGGRSTNYMLADSSEGTIMKE